MSVGRERKVRLGVTAAPFAFPRGFDLEAPTSGVLATLRVTRPAPAEREAERIQLLAKVFTPEGKEVGTVRQNAAVMLRGSGRRARPTASLPARGSKGARTGCAYFFFLADSMSVLNVASSVLKSRAA